MYESFFGFKQRPFNSAPRADRYFAGSSIETAHQTLARCIDRAAGPGLLIGPAGTGKSLLCHVLAERFAAKFHIAMLSSTQLCTRRALLQNILFELDLPYRGMEEGELRLSLIDFLEPGESSRGGMLLIVDEAHTLPLRLIEEIRMITNLVRNGQPRVRLVLAGGPILEERFANPKLESFNQRIAARCYLQPLSYDETHDYVRSQLAAVGLEQQQIFSDDALRAVYQATHGIPRLINQVCDHALVLAAVGQQHTLHAAGIEEAWADLQQLPMPWQDDKAPAGTDDAVIEFGALSESMASEPGEHAPDSNHAAADPDMLSLSEQLDNLQLKLAEVEAEAGELSLLDGGADHEQPIVERAVERILEKEFSPLPSRNPFGDDFEHEEVIVDRYAELLAESAGVDLYEDAGPSVSVQTRLDDQDEEDGDNDATTGSDASDGSALPVAGETPDVRQSLSDEADAYDESLDDESVPLLRALPHQAGDVTAELEEAAEPVTEPVEEPEIADEEDTQIIEDSPFLVAEEEEESDAEDQLATDPPSIPTASVIRVAPEDDSDIIVVVDEETPRRRGAAAESPSHRQEYRRLFSKLRQG